MVDTIQRDNQTQTQNQIEDKKMSIEEMNDRINYRNLQDQIDELRAEIKLLKNHE
jgi:peptidoglycan hydrolase CwlO-like protein